MGKKYLETKKDSLESSVLGVWKDAIEEGEAIRDAAQMTKKETKLDEGELPPALKKAIDAKKKDKDDDEEVKKESVELDEADWAVTFQKGSRVGARSHKIIYVQAKDEDDAVKKAKAGKGDGPKPEKGFSVSSVRKEGVAWENAQRFKVESMKAALAQIWGVKEGHNPFKKEDDDKILKKGGKTLTGKKAAEIDLNPEIKDR